MKSRTFPRTMCELPRIVFAQEFQLGKIFQELVTHTHTHTPTHTHTRACTQSEENSRETGI